MTTIVSFLYRNKVPGRARLFRILGKDGAFVRVHGFEIFLSPWDYVDSQVLQEGYYEPHVFAAVRDNLKSTETFWDVGANIGLHSFAVKTCQPHAAVFSFEPNPLSMRKIMMSRARNGIDIQTLTCALSSTNGMGELSVMTTGNPGLTSLSPWPNVAYDDRCLVPLVRADSLIGHGMTIPNVMKIDVEGHELDVLRGFGRYLADPQLHTIVFEDNGSERVHQLLRDAGFSIAVPGGKDSIARKSRTPEMRQS